MLFKKKKTQKTSIPASSWGGEILIINKEILRDSLILLFDLESTPLHSNKVKGKSHCDFSNSDLNYCWM